MAPCSMPALLPTRLLLVLESRSPMRDESRIRGLPAEGQSEEAAQAAGANAKAGAGARGNVVAFEIR